jgi:O-antigen ligase
MAFPAKRRPVYGGQPQGANLSPGPQNAAYFQNRMAFADNFRSQASFRVYTIVKFFFYVVVALLITNQLGQNARVDKATVAAEGYGRPLYPAVTMSLFFIVVAFTKERARGEYFLYSWAYWILFTIGGFLGAYQVTMTFPYLVAVIVLKMWIALITVPWIAFRVVSPDRLVFFQKYVIHVILFGAVLTILQIVLPAFPKGEFLEFHLSPINGRGHGCWLNSNACGAILLTGLICTTFVEWKSRTYLLVLRTILTLGIFCTFSRMAITSTLLAFLVIGLLSGKPMRLIIGLAATLVCVIAFFIFANMVEDGTIKLGGLGMTDRVQRISSLLKGDVSEESENTDRLALWEFAVQLIIERDGAIIGTGHGSMMTAANGLDPHNAYITAWGNSGLLGLLAYLGWYAGCFYLAWRIPNANLRAGLIAFFVIGMYRDLTSQNYFGNEFGGVYMAIPALNFYYGLKQKKPSAHAPPTLASA